MTNASGLKGRHHSYRFRIPFRDWKPISSLVRALNDLKVTDLEFPSGTGNSITAIIIIRQNEPSYRFRIPFRDWKHHFMGSKSFFIQFCYRFRIPFRDWKLWIRINESIVLDVTDLEFPSGTGNEFRLWMRQCFRHRVTDLEFPSGTGNLRHLKCFEAPDFLVTDLEFPSGTGNQLIVLINTKTHL